MDARPIVVVSTANVALQRQIVETDLPIATDAFARSAGRHLRIAMRVGKQQVIAAAALDTAVEASGAAGDRLLADEMIDWCEMSLARGELPIRPALLSAFSDRIAASLPWLSADFIGLRPEGAAHAATSALLRTLLEACAEADNHGGW